MSVTIVLATRNPDKVSEIRSLLGPCGLDIIGLERYPRLPEVEESGSTLEDNALLKARAASRETGLPAISDDTGLEVDFLGGRPGVRSSRYAGIGVSYAENVRKLLRELTPAGPGNRKARFRCVAAFVDGETEECFPGTCEGSITDVPRGENGFGYDPVFLPAGSPRTFGEMNPDEKNSISHRSAAFRALASYLRERYPTVPA